MFSQTADYALRAVIFLGQHLDEGAIGHRVIAKNTEVPTSYLSKILCDLAAADLLESRRGVGGGYRLAIDPHELTVLQVINAVDPIQRIEGCPLSLPAHCDQLCPMHSRIDESLAQVEKMLGASTIQEMMFDPKRPTPLVNERPLSAEHS